MNLPPVDPNVPRTVMVIEDEPRLRDMLLRAIPDMGFEAVGASSAEDALRRMAQRPASILILDLNLPGMDGLTLFKKLRDKDKIIQVIVLTGFGQLEAARTAIHLDVVDFLTKPCTLGDLEQALDRAWKRRLIAEQPVPEKPGLRNLAIETEPAPPDSQDHPHRLADIERTHILATLERHHGNRAKTARELGISTRTLYYRLAEYGHDEPEPT